MEKDPFGFKTQGVNYENFRPRYPMRLVEKCLSKLKNRNRYLDIATGTGQLLFALAPHFQKSVGTDISDQMLKVAKKKALEASENIQVLKKDCMESFNEKFDLVTIGQALHWFPLPDSIQHIAQNIVAKEGKFAVFSYYVEGIRQVEGQPIQHLYKDYYDLVKGQFDFDRDEIHREYSDPKYAFNQNFGSVQKQSEDDVQTMSSQSFIGYMKTYSGYNRYKEKYPTKQDPIVLLNQGLRNHKQVHMKIRYFTYYCSEPRSK